MPKKMIILTASPRPRGNTATVAGWVAEGARGAGAEVELVNVARLESATNGCIACMKCKKSDQFRCAIEDEVGDVIARLAGHDVLVFATPVYFMGFSAQLKLLVDRLYSQFKFAEDGSIASPLKECELALIATAGGERDHGLGLVEENMKIVAGFLGRELRSFLVPGAPPHPGEISVDQELRDRALAFGRELGT